MWCSPYLRASLVMLGAIMLIMYSISALGQVPDNATRHQRELTRLAQQEFGLAAPVALFAAQIHQESSWRESAKSPYAEGLSQFTPQTAEWIARVYPDLGSAAPYSPGWAMRALLRYDRHIKQRVKPWHARDIPDCDSWAFTLSGYNGGPGWIPRDRRQTEAAGFCSDSWFGHVERFSKRSPAAMRENRHYPHRILRELQPRYIRAGWQPGGAPPCLEL